jgi:hypothetical protein
MTPGDAATVVVVLEGALLLGGEVVRLRPQRSEVWPLTEGDGRLPSAHGKPARGVV